MPFQPTKTLTAYIMEEPLNRSLQHPSKLGALIFPSPTIHLLRLVLLCADAYIKGGAIGYFFRQNSDLIIQMMVQPEKVRERFEYLRSLSQERMNSYGSEMSSIMDFFITTEIAKDNMSFSDLIEQAKTRIKVFDAVDKVKLYFEEGFLFGVEYPEVFSSIMSGKNESALDWEQVKIMGLECEPVTKDYNLDFLRKWATYNLNKYADEYFPEFSDRLNLNNISYN